MDQANVNDLLAGVTCQFWHGAAFFDYPLGAAQRFGKYFDDYWTLVQREAVQAGEGYRDLEGKRGGVDGKRVPSTVRFDFGLCPEGRRSAAPTECQRTMLEWIVVRRQSEFVASVGEAILACYSDKKPARWRESIDWPPGGGRDLFFFGGVPPAPMIPTDYALEDFVRITHIDLIQRALVFGVSVKVAWSAEEIGLRFEANARAAGDERAAFWCVLVGPQDVAFC